jgi:hypothetical protein
MKPPMRYGIYALIGLLIAVNLSLAAWLWIENQSSPSSPSFNAQDCDLNQGPCTLSFVWQGLPHIAQLTLSPQPVPIAKPLAVDLRLDGPLALEKAAIEITGTNMYMGFNRQALTQKSPTVWQGSTILGFCTESEMQWQVQIQLTDTGGQTSLLNFPLNTFRK